MPFDQSPHVNQRRNGKKPLGTMRKIMDAGERNELWYFNCIDLGFCLYDSCSYPSGLIERRTVERLTTPKKSVDPSANLLWLRARECFYAICFGFSWDSIQSIVACDDETETPVWGYIHLGYLNLSGYIISTDPFNLNDMDDTE